MTKTKILLVDDDPFSRRLFGDLLGDRGIPLTQAVNCAQARAAFHAADFNLVLLDQRLPDGNGLDMFAEMREERPRQVAILVTGYADVRDAVRAVRAGLFDYLTKPFGNLEELEAVIDKALELDGAYREIARLRETLAAGGEEPTTIGRSAAIGGLLMQARQVAPLDTTVLIEGESGTGKELVARLIHGLSRRAGGRLLEVNCGALSESLLESALFGYEKGAFTGAAKATPGYFEEANGGTLFLDEIADMSPKLQSSLLRVLQEGTFSRLGETRKRQSDFRLVLATNRPLAAEVEAGRFRIDLYYRVNVVVLRTPPLRERPEDILPLALHFLDHFNRKFGRDAGPFTPEALAALEAAHWPGNVRELKHLVERVVAVKAAGPIVAPDLALPRSPGSVPGTTGLPTYRDAKDAFERDYFTRLVVQAGNNVTEAARLSGIARQNLYPHLKRIGIDTNS
ncbi:MAG: sigma-54 dependent transcriptional regulator [Candidatus Nitricoxidivorans perseverans]|uniref:Sigma-54 dependent transcriptional regulator n=1 Tax=Candidatus Nitricoxidivorans perseverans TaxID=2975601 RepID=A0AA49J0N6_9PROT|nr:MAG: sigma-54 dependent transcriptional regulator [Candidatus Nitricoxidivorans perseverans]